MHLFDDKVENGFASNMQTLNTENKELITELKNQFKIHNEQIQELIKIITTKLK